MLTKESIKQLLKPDWRKILFAVMPISFVLFGFSVSFTDTLSTELTDEIFNSLIWFLLLIFLYYFLLTLSLA